MESSSASLNDPLIRSPNRIVDLPSLASSWCEVMSSSLCASHRTRGIRYSVLHQPMVSVDRVRDDLWNVNAESVTVVSGGLRQPLPRVGGRVASLHCRYDLDSCVQLGWACWYPVGCMTNIYKSFLHLNIFRAHYHSTRLGVPLARSAWGPYSICSVPCGDGIQVTIVLVTRMLVSRFVPVIRT